MAGRLRGVAGGTLDCFMRTWICWKSEDWLGKVQVEVRNVCVSEDMVMKIRQ